MLNIMENQIIQYHLDTLTLHDESLIFLNIDSK